MLLKGHTCIKIQMSIKFLIVFFYTELILITVGSNFRGHDGALVTHLPPTSEVGCSNSGPYESL